MKAVEYVLLFFIWGMLVYIIVFSIAPVCLLLWLLLPAAAVYVRYYCSQRYCNA